MGADDELVLVAAHRAERDFRAGQFLLQFLLQFPAPVVEEMVFLLVPGEGGGGEDLALVRPEQATGVDFGMLEDELKLFSRGGVDTDNGRFVPADVGRGVEILVVVGEEERIGAFTEVRAQDFLERFVFRRPGQQLGVHPVGLHRGAHPPVVIGDPRGHTTGILRHHFHFAVARVEAEHVEHAGVALVHADEQMVLVVAQVVDHADADAGERREVATIAAVRIDGIKMEIFVPAVVLQVDNLVLGRPEIPRDVALGRIGQPPRFADTVGGLDEHIEPVFPRGEP